MKLYRTKEDNVINLEQLSAIYKDPETGNYRVATAGGHIFEMPEIEPGDIDKIMDYNNYLID